MGYRHAADVDRPEDESAALQELGRRRSRLRARVLGLVLVAGVLLGIGGHLFVTEVQLALLGRAWIYLSILLGFFPPLIASGSVALRLGRWAVRRRTGAWLSELASLHRVSRGALAEEASLLQKVEAEAELDAIDG